MDGNAKHDLERTAEKTVNISSRIGRILTKLFSKALIWLNKKYQKIFSSSMKTLKKDGNTKELSVSPPLTKEEAKEIISKAREGDVLIGVKKMEADGEYGKKQSLYQQEKLAKNEIKCNKWKSRKQQYKNIPLLNSLCDSRIKKYKNQAMLDNANNKEERYIVICNKSHISFLTEQLENLQKKRIQKMADNELDDINKDGIIDELDYETLISRDINISPKDLNQIGTDYGSCLVRDYQKNYCKQRITKSEYCEIREQLFDLKSHGACLINENEVLIAINSDDLEEYKKFAPLDKPIKEFGENGARDIESEDNVNNIIQLEIANEKDFLIFKKKYKGRDFVAEHNADGTISAIVKEQDTKQMVSEAQKKSSTADLLKEANEFALKNEAQKEAPEIELEEEEELAR